MVEMFLLFQLFEGLKTPSLARSKRNTGVLAIAIVNPLRVNRRVMLPESEMDVDGFGKRRKMIKKMEKVKMLMAYQINIPKPI